MPPVQHIFFSGQGHHRLNNGFSPVWCQAIIWTSDGISSIAPRTRHFRHKIIVTNRFPLTKLHFKIVVFNVAPFLRGRWYKHTKGDPYLIREGELWRICRNRQYLVVQNRSEVEMIMMLLQDPCTLWTWPKCVGIGQCFCWGVFLLTSQNFVDGKFVWVKLVTQVQLSDGATLRFAQYVY